MGRDWNSTPGGRVESLSRSVREHRRHPILGALARLANATALPTLGAGIVVAIVFASLATLLVNWTRQQPLVTVGRVMDETRLVRTPVRTIDLQQTEQQREAARQATPRVYVADSGVLEAIVQSLENLPVALAGASGIETVDSGIREQFGLSRDALAALQAESRDGKPTTAWTQRVEALRTIMRLRPILDGPTYQRAVTDGRNVTIQLVYAGRTMPPVFRSQALNVEDEVALVEAARDIARDAEFMGLLREVVVSRLTRGVRPTYTFDAAATAAAQNEEASRIAPVVIESPRGQVIFERGDVLTPAQAELFAAELREHAQSGGGREWLFRLLGAFGAAAGVTLAMFGYTALFCRRAAQNGSRSVGLAAILLSMLAVACLASVWSPGLTAATATAPTLLAAVLVVIGYDRRSALAYGLLHAVLVCLALRESVGTMAVTITGIACIVWTLREIRDRGAIMRASLATAAGFFVATLVFAMLERPITTEVWVTVARESLADALIAAGGAVGAGGATLFVLPLVEKAFNVTTGLTLIELRDPKQPLLRELQQRAPGTYNHSLNVAAIAEAAADAIGADPLLAYVGALYHDIGKMNKPEYFVENQSAGINKHDKLSPAMSLLIVVGNVKDGMELAREFSVPANIQHFIEAHHGTTLVEFFYHRARQRALESVIRGKDGELDPDATRDTYVPDEFEYRYPGPKPLTKEVAILMIADAVESATRAMGDPSPSKIEALVRAIANKRLMDGQFDDCELTLRELSAICESVVRTLTSMYHGRIAYPGGNAPTRATTIAGTPTPAQGSAATSASPAITTPLPKSGRA